jgi:hypothetical protein
MMMKKMMKRWAMSRNVEVRRWGCEEVFYGGRYFGLSVFCCEVIAR